MKFSTTKNTQLSRIDAINMRALFEKAISDGTQTFGLGRTPETQTPLAIVLFLGVGGWVKKYVVGLASMVRVMTVMVTSPRI